MPALILCFIIDEASDITSSISTGLRSTNDRWFSEVDYLSLSPEQSEPLIAIILLLLFLPAVVLSINASLSSFIGSISSRYLYSISSCLTISSSCSGLIVLGGRAPDPVGEVLKFLHFGEPWAESCISEVITISLILSMIFGNLAFDALVFDKSIWRSSYISYLAKADYPICL